MSLRLTRLLALAAALALAFTAGAQEKRLTLDDAIRLALERNKVIKVEAFGRPIARANYLAALGHFDPAVNFSRSYAEAETPVTSNPVVTQLGKTDNYGLTLDGLTPWGLTYSIGGTAVNNRTVITSFANSYSTFGGITVTQPLLRGFGFGANLANLRIARADRSISEWDYRAAVINTTTNVIVAYNNLLLARENLRVAEFSRSLAQQLLTENEKRFKVGAMSEADVTQARARVALQVEAILYADRAMHDADNYLRKLLGEDHFVTDGTPLDLEPLPPAADTPINPAEDLQKALNLRPDYQAARLGIKKYEANNSLARNQLLPRLDFVGSYGYAGLDRDFAASRAQVRDQDNRAYSAGVVVSVPLTFTEGRGRARAARLTLRQADADLKRLESDIALNVTAAAGQIETTRKRVTATKEAYEFAKQALDAEEKRLRAGTSNTLFVVNLQENLVEVENRHAAALADARNAIALYDREIGTTLERNHINLAKE
ncbi:MAG: TolC family protein [Verrucomicrobia bacterium]|nr:TolC family protein [Verrucomicrobiota bacterium]